MNQTRDEVDGIAAVFQSLLQLSQVENNALKSKFTSVDLAELCRTMVEVYEPSAHDNDQTLVCSVPDELPVLGEKNLLGQMIANLLENALRHSGAGCSIDLSLTQTDGVIELAVSDNGPGIPPDEWGRVTQRLYRLDRSRNTAGNGLGLSLVEGVARLHGADFSFADAMPGLIVRVRFSPS